MRKEQREWRTEESELYAEGYRGRKGRYREKRV